MKSFKSIKIFTEASDEVKLSFFDDTEVDEDESSKGLLLEIITGQGAHTINIKQDEIEGFIELMKNMCFNSLK